MKPLIVLAGPTAVGKTALSLRLAKRLNGSIVGADAMQVYRGMDVGTAKIARDAMEGIPHYLIDEIDPKEPFHAAAYQQRAKAACEDSWAKGRIPILCGGTGFYIQALLYNIDFSAPSENAAYRKKLDTLAKEREEGFLYRLLLAQDPKAAAGIHPHNTKRLLRALEYIHETGEPFSVYNEREKRRTSPYVFRYFVINRAREYLYAAINRRVEAMFAEGLIEEVKALMAYGCTPEMTSMQGIGYKETLHWLLQKETDVAALKTAVALHTRHYAKRQLTWFRREKAAVWLAWEDFAEDEEKMLAAIMEKSREALAFSS